MNTKAHSTSASTQKNHSLPLQRETIIKKAQENVRVSHQRMRTRCHGRCV